MADVKISDGSLLAPIRATDLIEVERPSVATQYRVELQSLGMLKAVAQASHGFAVFDAIGHNGSAYVKADASSGVEIACLGIVVQVVDTGNFVWACHGVHTITSHGATLGQNYLSETAGAVTTTKPGPSHLVQSVLWAIDANTVLINIGEALT